MPLEISRAALCSCCRRIYVLPRLNSELKLVFLPFVNADRAVNAIIATTPHARDLFWNFGVRPIWPQELPDWPKWRLIVETLTWTVGRRNLVGCSLMSMISRVKLDALTSMYNQSFSDQYWPQLQLHLESLIMIVEQSPARRGKGDTAKSLRKVTPCSLLSMVCTFECFQVQVQAPAVVV